MPFDWFILIPAAFFAGMVDAVVGGGGLIQIPALLQQFPHSPLATVFGTNKLASIVGTSTAFLRYAKSVRIPWHMVMPATACALPGAWGGAKLVAWLPRESMQPWIVILLIGVTSYTLIKKDFGQTNQYQAHPRWKAGVFGGIIGFYDGFFGPGTGSFLIFGFVCWFGLDFVASSASAKVVNVATNLSAIAYFSSHGPLLWEVGITMAVCNLTGAMVGTHIALTKGSTFMRKAFIAVMLLLICKQLWLLFTPQ